MTWKFMEVETDMETHTEVAMNRFRCNFKRENATHST